MNDAWETFEALDRRLVEDLRTLGEVTAPPSLVPAVLVRTGLADGYWRIETPIGSGFVAWSPDGLTALLLGEDVGVFEQDYGARFGRRIVSAEPPPSLTEAVERRLAGDRSASLPFALRGLTEFERAVLEKAREIPRGEVRPYGWVAKEIGRPAAVRAVGSALGRNPVPLLIPCHRVLRSDGRVGDYVFGTERKRALLDLEGARPDELETEARAGVRLHGSDTTKIFCYPTCRCARRMTDRHRVTFGSAGEAAAAGFRPCKVCRPVAA
jgi:O-6-methylguanine DNA methyltransferase